MRDGIKMIAGFFFFFFVCIPVLQEAGRTMEHLMESDASCTIPGLHISRKFLADINRMPCPVALRKEQIDYLARASDPPTTTSPLSFVPFSAFSSLFLPSSSSFLLGRRRFRTSFARARFLRRETRGFLFGVDGAKSSSN